MNKQVTRTIAALCLFAFLQPLTARAAAAPDDLVVIDLRPQNEKEGTGLSPVSGKCNKGVFRIADVASDPLKIEVLKNDLARELGMAADGKTLTVLNWSIYYNKVAAHGGSKFGNVGLMGYSLPHKEKEKERGSKCTREESAGGWYEAGEVTTSAAPLVSEFEGTFAGKPLSVRIVYSPHRKIEGKFDGDPDDTNELIEAVDKTAEALAAAIVK
ncbi:MAG TPA: hypothetical protein VGO61_19610 [Steroidobacteraceae bacterium]|jgi:hypothetical protein|nr:hypothetical protein [Steroidobacteraceae bacterium]